MSLNRSYHFLRFLRSQFFASPPYPTEPWTGKVVIVTGGNRGLGLAAAHHFARLGASRIILAVRDTSSGFEAKRNIERGVTQGSAVDVWHLELSSPASIEAFAKRAADSLNRLDALVENAGIATRSFRLAAGREATVAVNVLGTFHLALLLLPQLRATARKYIGASPHISIVNSDVIFYTSFPERLAPRIFEHLNDEATSRMLARYSVTKIMAAMCVRELVARSGPTDSVIINYVNPGLCSSDILRETSWLGYALGLCLARSAEVGGRALVLAADSGVESRGKYLSDGRVEDPPPFLESQEGQETQLRVWSELMELLEEVHPGIQHHVAGAGKAEGVLSEVDSNPNHL